MMISIYSIPIQATANMARHYYLSPTGDFEQSVGWGPTGVEWRGTLELSLEQRDRINEYAEKFGMYNIHSNNCEMFAWYVMTGKRYSKQTQESISTKVGAAIVQLIQPVHTVRSMNYLAIERAIVTQFEEELNAVKRQRWHDQQAETDAFWARRDADLSK